MLTRGGLSGGRVRGFLASGRLRCRAQPNTAWSARGWQQRYAGCTS